MSRKTSLIVRIVVLSVLLLGLLAMAVRMLWWVGRPGQAEWNWDGRREMVLSESYRGVTSVEVSTLSYAVEVVEHSGSETMVEFYRGFGATSREQISVTQNNGVLKVEQKPQFGLFSWGNCKVVVYVPQASPMDYDLASTSGSVKLNAPGKAVSVSTTSGSVKVYQGGETLSAVSTSGSVKVYEGFVTIDAGTTSGSVKVKAAQNTTRIVAESTSGSVKIQLPRDMGYVFDFSSVSGSVKDLYREKSFGSEGSSEYGGRDVAITASTVSGSIKLCDWDD